MPCHTSWREPITFVKSVDRIHSLAVRKWTPHLVSWPNDRHLRSHKIDSHSTPNTRFRGFLKALLSCHSCLVINYIAKDRYAHNPKIDGWTSLATCKPKRPSRRRTKSKGLAIPAGAPGLWVVRSGLRTPNSSTRHLDLDWPLQPMRISVSLCSGSPVVGRS